MKILHILKAEPEENIRKIIEEHKKDHVVEVIDFTKNKDYEMAVELIEKADKVISW